jgi:hypothetical protein
MSVAACACRQVQASAEPSLPPSLEEGASRRPDGVVVEPPPAIPSAVERAEARGVVALSAPVDEDKIRALVLSVSDAWKRGSLDGLRDLLTPDAVDIDSSKGGRPALLDRWKERLGALSTDRLPGGSLYALDRLARWTYDDLSDGGAPPRPASMRRGDVYVRVPFHATHLGPDRVFGDVLVLVIRREGGRLLVAGYGEASDPWR